MYVKTSSNCIHQSSHVKFECTQAYVHGSSSLVFYALESHTTYKVMYVPVERKKLVKPREDGTHPVKSEHGYKFNSVISFY